MGKIKRKAMAGKSTELILVLVVFIIASALLMRLYYTQGVYWDFVTHFLYAKALTSGYFYGSLDSGTLAISIQNGAHFYVEPFRAPLMSFLMAPFILLSYHPIPAYLIFETALLLVSSVYLARSLRVSPLVAAPMALLPYVMVYLTVLNGAELLSLILLLFAFGLAARKRWQAGILVALAALAKYSSVVFFVPLFFMPKGTRLKALAAGLVTTLPWFAFNSFVYGDPVYSYLSAVKEVFVIPPPSPTSVPIAVIGSLWIILVDLLPFMLIAASLAMYTYAKHRALLASFDYRYRIATAFLVVSVLIFAAFCIKGSVDTLPRWGYILYAGMVPILSLLIYDLSVQASIVYKERRIIPAVYSAIFIIFVVLSASAYVQLGEYPFGTLLGTKSVILGNAVQEVNALGISGCNVISNAWPYLRFDSITAHYPFYYNLTMYRYPIVIFDSFVNDGETVAEENISHTYNYSGFQILMPENHTC